MKTASRFMAWFKLQHGRRGRLPDLANVTDKALEKRIEAGLRAQVEMDFRKEWDSCQKSALYAWQARESH